MKATVRVDGLRQLDQALAQFTKATAKGVLRRVGIKALGPMADTAASLAPDDPETPDPDLESSVTVGTKLNKRQASLARRDDGKAFVTVYMGTNDPAGIQQEFGNQNHGPQPFMRPAFDQHKHGAIKIVAEELGAEIDKTAKRVAARAAKKAAK